MNRRGFIGGLVGLTAGAVAAKTVSVKNVQPAPRPMRLRQVIVDYRQSSDWISPQRGEQIFIDCLRRNTALLKRIVRN